MAPSALSSPHAKHSTTRLHQFDLGSSVVRSVLSFLRQNFPDFSRRCRRVAQHDPTQRRRSRGYGIETVEWRRQSGKNAFHQWIGWNLPERQKASEGCCSEIFRAIQGRINGFRWRSLLGEDSQRFLDHLLGDVVRHAFDGHSHNRLHARMSKRTWDDVAAEGKSLPDSATFLPRHEPGRYWRYQR